MSDYKFKRVNDEENEYEDGDYRGELCKLDKKDGTYGEVINGCWLILYPEKYKGRLKWENFNIGSDIPEIRQKSRDSFNKFWSQMTDDDDGADFDFQKVLYKEAHLKIKNYDTKEGIKRPYIVHRRRVDRPDKKSASENQSFSVPQKPSTGASVLPDDEIPF